MIVSSYTVYTVPGTAGTMIGTTLGSYYTAHLRHALDGRTLTHRGKSRPVL
jgi:hypothetical protein